MRVLSHQVMAVFSDPTDFCGRSWTSRTVGGAVVEVFRPGDSVTDRKRITPQIGGVRPELVDDPNDVVAENSGARIGTKAVIGMDVGSTDGTSA